MGIFDVTETFGMTSSIGMSWNNQCVRHALQSPDFELRNISKFQVDQDRLWNPKLLHINSRFVKPLRGGDFERATIMDNQGNMTTFFYGFFESSCDLQLQNFPFDT